MNPLVSVIVPCYNQGRFLGEALDSLINQTYTNWECIIVNDGSTDNTREIAQDYVNRDPRFHYIEQENRGLSGARNRGLQEIKGRFVQLLDSDDAIAPTKFQKQLSIQNEDGLVVIYCNYFFGKFDDISQKINRHFPKPKFVLKQLLWDIAARWETSLSIPCHCFLFDARFFIDHNIRFDEALPTHEDWDCWMQIFSLNLSLIFVPDELATYRVNATSMCTNHEKMWSGFRDAIFKQQKIWRHDPTISKFLKEKLRQMRVRYEYDPINNLCTFFIKKSWFKKYIPWPIQKKLTRFVEWQREFHYEEEEYLERSDQKTGAS